MANPLNNHKIIAAAAIWLLYHITATLFPASFWLEISAVKVSNTAKTPILYVERTIKRPFQATWTATVRSLENDTTVVACAASATSTYSPNAMLPIPATLGWWTNGTCTALDPGYYVLETTWVIHTNPFIPDKTVTATSNIFQVTGEL